MHAAVRAAAEWRRGGLELGTLAFERLLAPLLRGTAVALAHAHSRVGGARGPRSSRRFVAAPCITHGGQF